MLISTDDLGLCLQIRTQLPTHPGIGSAGTSLPPPPSPLPYLDSLPQVKTLITHPKVSGELARQSPRNLGREKQVAFLSQGCNAWDYFIKV